MFKEISVLDKLPEYIGPTGNKIYMAYFKDRPNIPGEGLNPEKAKYVQLVFLHMADAWLSNWSVQIGFDHELIDLQNEKFKHLVWLEEIYPLCANCREGNNISLQITTKEFTCGCCHHTWKQ